MSQFWMPLREKSSYNCVHVSLQRKQDWSNSACFPHQFWCSPSIDCEHLGAEAETAEVLVCALCEPTGTDHIWDIWAWQRFSPCTWAIGSSLPIAHLSRYLPLSPCVVQVLSSWLDYRIYGAICTFKSVKKKLKKILRDGRRELWVLLSVRKRSMQL